MVYPGHIRNGLIVLDEPCVPPEGASVQVVIDPSVPQPTDGSGTCRYERLKPLIGSIKGLPADFAAEHDHYMHGTPKRS